MEELYTNPDNMAFLVYLNLFVIILGIIMHLLMAWGLYLINKKLGEPHPWLAWIPYIQYYSFVKAGGKPGIWLLWFILGCFLFFIPGLIIWIMVCSGISKRTGGGTWRTVGILFVPFIVLPIVGTKLEVKSDKLVNSENEKTKFDY